jgi:hypothetical protein
MINNEIFISRAKKIHGEQYDYSKVEYKGMHTKVCIICPIHKQPFLQTPHNHLKGQRCPLCYGTPKSNTEEFIKKARKVHGDRYDYSKVEYKDNRTNVCIICSKCKGPFWQSPTNHLDGHGCPTCGRTKKLNNEEFIKKARDVHGNKYDYSKVEYKNTITEICIICPCAEHNEFWQRPLEHLQGCGCPKCGGNYHPSTEEFIEKARLIHGDKYDYSEVKYINNKTKICIICPEHEPFWQTPNNHLSGHGCPNCKESKLEKMVKQFLIDNNFKFTHNERNFEWLKLKKKLQLDFYLTDYNVAVECQGRQHFEIINEFGGEKIFMETQERDEIKKQLCKEYGVKLFYINYDDNVEEKMNEILFYIKTKFPQ